MAGKTPLPEQFLARLKGHRLVAFAIVAGTIVIALASFTDAAKRLASAFSPARPEEARAELSRLSLPYTTEAFVAAAERGDAVAVKHFVAAGMPVDEVLMTHESNTALIAAARRGRLEVVKQLLAAKADPYKQVSYGTALSAAAAAGHRDLMLVLLEHERKPPVELVDEAFTSAAYLGRHEVMQLLHKHGARIERIGPEALINVAYSGRSDEKSAVACVDWLLKSGVDPGGSNNERGWTALHYAAYDGHAAVAEKLLKHTNPNVRDREGATPLWWAAGVGRHEHAKLLLDRGADPNARARNGDTPLRRAQYNRDEEMVRLLLAKGAVADTPAAGAKP